jgi:UDP:flavonoid glycosyltransferase YjiC (YdhE family)
MIKVCVIGNIQLIQERFPCSIADWLIFRELTADDFYAHLASADLVFQHQGLATMAQAISAQIPVIAHVRHQRPSGPDWIENAELSPLQRAGLCKLFSAESPIEAITQMVEELLYHPQAIEQIQRIQQAYHSQGERCISRTIMQYLEIRDERQLTWATR